MNNNHHRAAFIGIPLAFAPTPAGIQIVCRLRDISEDFVHRKVT